MTGRSVLNERRILRLANAATGLGLLIRFAFVEPAALTPLWLIVILALCGFGELALSFMGRRDDPPPRSHHHPPDHPAQGSRLARRDDDPPTDLARLCLARLRRHRCLLA